MTLKIFAFLYTFITVLFIRNIYADQSASLGYAFIFPVFWVIGAIVLFGLHYKKSIRIYKNSDWLYLIFSTPIPTLIFFMVGYSLNESPSSTYEYNKNGHRHRVITYSYSNRNYKRREFYVSKDTVTEVNPFPISDEWLKDSTWIYFDKDGKIEKKENYNSNIKKTTR